MWKMCRQTKQRYVLPCAVQSGDSADSTNQFVKTGKRKWYLSSRKVTILDFAAKGLRAGKMCFCCFLLDSRPCRGRVL